MKKADRNLIIVSTIFWVYAVLSGLVSSHLPGQTRAQAADAEREVVIQCATAKARNAHLVAQAAACAPAPLRRVDAWLTAGMLMLGTLLVFAGVAANREN